MTLKEIKSESFWPFSYENFQKIVESFCVSGIKQFKKIIRSYIFFHLFFIGFLSLEIILFFLFLTFLCQTSFLAFSLAGIILTGFSYLVLLFYFQTKKPEQFLELRNWFMLLCKKKIPKNLETSEYHLSLANAAYRFASELSLQEAHFYSLPKNIGSLNHLMRTFSTLCLQKDIHKMKEILLLVTINEHLQLIKQTPTDLEAHASLANAYISLSKLYLHKGQPSKILRDKFTSATQKAIQEFKIMDHYAPNDPWVHAQLASCYHDLHLYKEEIREYEMILFLCPNDKEIMFRLGILYFQQGLNAKGLQIYEALRRLHFSRADELIDFYDANIKQEYYIGIL
jgi:tetratricopeptide (TPR) repeat protein